MLNLSLQVIPLLATDKDDNSGESSSIVPTVVGVSVAVLIMIIVGKVIIRMILTITTQVVNCMRLKDLTCR